MGCHVILHPGPTAESYYNTVRSQVSDSHLAPSPLTSMSRKLADPISELGVFHNTTGTSNLPVGDDLGEGAVMGDLKHLSSLCLEENSPCEGLSESSYFFSVTVSTIATD